MNHRNMLLSKPLAWLIFFSAVLVFSSTASAVPPALNPGNTLYSPQTVPAGFFATSGYYVSAPLPPQYSVLVTTFDFPYKYNGTLNNAFVGFVRSSVYKNPADNTLAFTYVLNNLTPFAGAPATDIVRATINDPSDPWQIFNITAAGADPNSGGHSTPINGFFGAWNNGMPFDLARSATDFGVAIELNPLNSGTQLNQPSTNPASPNGDQSALVWFTTDATKFNFTNVSLSDNGHVGTGQAFSPNTVQGPLTPPTPEPSSIVLSGLGALGGGFWLWRRQRPAKQKARV
jgi:PEP-CTERM motif-containing protein